MKHLFRSKNSDMRVVDTGDIAGISHAIKTYLHDKKFQIDREEVTSDRVQIDGSNLQGSVVKLFLTNAPQIVEFRVRRKTGRQLLIEIGFDLFGRFRVSYLGCLVSLMLGFGILFKISVLYTSINRVDEFFYSLLLMVAGYFLLMVALVLSYRLLYPGRYESFVDGFYSKLHSKGIFSRAIQGNAGFPDFWKVFSLFLLLFVIFLLDNLHFIYANGDVFLYGVIIFVCISTVILSLLRLRRSMSKRMLFCLTGVSLCGPMVILSNLPLLDFMLNDITFQFKSIYNDPSESYLHLPQKLQLPISAYFTSYWFFILFIIAVLLFPIVTLPVRLTRELSRFNTKQQDSLYYQALLPKDLKVFIFAIIAIWGVLSIGLLTGLYLSLSVLEKTILSTNYLFSTNITNMFFNSTQILFELSLQPYFSTTSIRAFHKTAMLMYTLPLLIMFSIIHWKNWKTFWANYFLINRRDKQFANIETKLSERLREICKFAGIKTPLVRITKSYIINAEAKHIDFPSFKSILVITDGTWHTLKDNEKELEALLAHEVWHIKKHTLWLQFLCLLSDYTFFGNGFLAALQNSFKMEKEADEFAVKWLVHKYGDKDTALNTMKTLLERQEEINAIPELFEPQVSLKFSMVKNDSYRNKLLAMYEKSSFWRKLLINLKLLYQLYFGNEIISYFHPPISQRIAWIKGEE